MYRGLTPNLLGNMVGLGSYFLFYSSFKQQLATLSAIDDVGPGKLNMYQYFIASGAAGTNPLLISSFYNTIPLPVLPCLTPGLHQSLNT